MHCVRGLHIELISEQHQRRSVKSHEKPLQKVGSPHWGLQPTYLCGLEHFPGWDLLAQLCQGGQQVVLALPWQLQRGLVAHDVLNHNHPLWKKRDE